jgi:thiol-disulfide isomerase/thioredoxin
MMKLGAVVLMILSAFSLACNSAAPPKSAAEVAAPRTNQPNATPSPDEQAVASALDVPIEKFDGASFKLADFRGKVTVVDFWRSDCGPCVKMVPKLARISKQYRDQGVEVIGLTSDEKSIQTSVSNFLKKAGADYIVGYDNRWMSSAFLKGTEDETGSPPIPQVFVLSRDGRVVEHLIGDHPFEAMEQVIKNALSQTTK